MPAVPWEARHSLWAPCLLLSPLALSLGVTSPQPSRWGPETHLVLHAPPCHGPAVVPGPCGQQAVPEASLKLRRLLP